MNRISDRRPHRETWCVWFSREWPLMDWKMDWKVGVFMAQLWWNPRLVGSLVYYSRTDAWIIGQDLEVTHSRTNVLFGHCRVDGVYCHSIGNSRGRVLYREIQTSQDASRHGTGQELSRMVQVRGGVGSVAEQRPQSVQQCTGLQMKP
jgi:hypothetical protein